MCLAGCLEGESAADDRSQLALVKQAGEGAGAVAVVLDEHAVEGDVGIEQRVQVQLRGGDRGDLPAGPQRGQGGLGQAAADQVGDGVDRPAGQHPGTGGDILAGVVDAGRGAEAAHPLVHRLAAVSVPRGIGKSWAGAVVGLWRLLCGVAPQDIGPA